MFGNESDQDAYNYHVAADTVDSETSPSLITRVGDAVLKGGLGAAVSGTMSIVNSFVDTDTTGSVEDVIRGIGGDESADYYARNKEIIDTVGFVGASIATYGAGTLALKAARAGFMLGPVARATNFLPDANRAALGRAISALAEPGATMTAKIAQTRNARLGWAVADNILTATAGEAMTVAVLGDSPMMEGYSASDFVINAGLFGAIGGGVEFLAGRAVMREAASLIDMRMRAFNTVSDLSKYNLKKNNEITALADELTKLDYTFNSTPFTYSYGGVKNTLEIDTADLFRSTRDRTMKTGLSMIETKMNELAAGNVNLGQSFSRRITSILTGMGDTPEARLAARDDIASLLAPIGKLISNRDLDAVAEEGAALYLRKSPEMEGTVAKLFERKFSPELTERKPYVLKEGVKEKDLVTATSGDKYPKATDAFADGVDIFYNSKGRAVVNPGSPRIARSADELTTKTGVLHVESGDWSFDPIYTAADDISNIKKDVVLSRDGNGVIIGRREYRIPLKSEALPLDVDTMSSSARYIWASQLDAKAIEKVGTINARDLPLLDRLAEVAPDMTERLNKIFIELADGSKVLASEISDLAAFSKKQKQGWLYEYNAAGNKEGTKILAVHLNSTMKFADEVIGSNYALAAGHEGGVLRTMQAAEPRTVGALWDNQKQFFRGTDSLGNEITGALMKRTRTEFKYADLMEQIGVKHVSNPKDAIVEMLRRGVPEDQAREWAARTYKEQGTNFFMQALGDPLSKQQIPTMVQTDKTVSANVKAVTGLGLKDIIAHEVGHALDFFISAKENRSLIHHTLIESGHPEMEALRKEMYETSKSFRPTQWKTQPTYVRRGDELFADNFAMWMTRPDFRPQMKEFAARFGRDLEMYEQHFAQSVWERTAGPMLGADAKLAHEYELQMRKTAANNAVLSTMDDFGRQLIGNMPKLATSIDSLGSGPTLWGASNAGYSDQDALRRAMQYTGRIGGVEKERLKTVIRNELSSTFAGIRADPAAAAELSMAVNAVRRTESPFYHVTVGVDQSGNKLEKVKNFFVTEPVKQMLDKGEDYYAAVAKVEAAGQQARLPIQREAVSNLLVKHMELNRMTQEKKGVLMSALGVKPKTDFQRLYVPPIDTQRFPYIAFVRQKPGLGASNEVSMITARDGAQLRKLMSEIDNSAYDVFDKTDVKNFYEAKGAYDYAHAFNDNRVTSSLRREGKLGDFFPETRSELVLEDFARFHFNQQDSLVNTAIQTQYADLFGQLKFLSDEHTRVESSVARGKFAQLTKRFEDPYGDLIKTGLGMQKMGEFPLLDTFNEFLDGIGRKAYRNLSDAFRKADAGLISYQDANRLAEQYGLGNPYTSVANYITANQPGDKNLIAVVSAKANRVLSTLGLRLDAANALVNIMSTPIMLGMEHASLKSLAMKDSALAGPFRELYSTAVPGKNMQVPSYGKLLFNAVSNYFKDDGRLMERYRPIAGMNDLLGEHRLLLEEMGHRPWEPVSALSARVDKAVEKAGKWTGNDFAEQFTRFVSADVMRQQTDILEQAGKISRQEADAYISSFVNRAQGNYVQSQRPLLFQGTAGRAVSLFQTYMFNVAQQLTRHVEDRNVRALAVFGAMQTSIYGLQGLPYFDAVNSHLISQLGSNPERKDAYSVLTNANEDIGKWLLYGTASAFPIFDGAGPALYSRGDLNPRTMIGLPTSWKEIPAVNASLKLIDTVMTLGGNVAGGGDIANSMLMALEHQGMSRPLAGFAQLVSGRSTTSKGSLVAASNDLATTADGMRLFSPEGLVHAATLLAGAKPLDQAIAMNQLTRNAQYKLEDAARIERLGEIVKTKLYNNQVPSDEETMSFMSDYMRHGGTQQQFAKSMQRWMRDANTSVINQMSMKMKDPYAKRLQVMMGGEDMPDYNNQEVRGLPDVGTEDPNATGF